MLLLASNMLPAMSLIALFLSPTSFTVGTGATDGAPKFLLSISSMASVMPFTTATELIRNIIIRGFNYVVNLSNSIICTLNYAASRREASGVSTPSSIDSTVVPTEANIVYRHFTILSSAEVKASVLHTLWISIMLFNF